MAYETEEKETGVAPICYKGAKAICKAAGENPREIANLVKSGFPAFKVRGKGPWKALPEDLKTWVKMQRDNNLNLPIKKEGKN